MNSRARGNRVSTVSTAMALALRRDGTVNSSSTHSPIIMPRRPQSQSQSRRRIAELSVLAIVAFVRRFHAPGHTPTLVIEREHPFFAVKADAPGLAVQIFLGPDPMLPHQTGVRKVERGDLRVRRLLIIVVEILVSGAGDA